jgi:hypothetical protein
VFEHVFGALVPQVALDENRSIQDPMMPFLWHDQMSNAIKHQLSYDKSFHDTIVDPSDDLFVITKIFKVLCPHFPADWASMILNHPIPNEIGRSLAYQDWFSY